MPFCFSVVKSIDSTTDTKRVIFVYKNKLSVKSIASITSVF
jgi:hypothetical protein